MLVAFFPVIASNVYWSWTNDCLAGLFALAACAIVDRLIKFAMIRRAYAEMRALCGAEWENG
ncbi:hypothetical protein Q3C01_08315 [Bradyrhizobium sp. UFLA05-109]